MVCSMRVSLRNHSVSRNKTWDEQKFKGRNSRVHSSIIKDLRVPYGLDRKISTLPAICCGIVLMCGIFYYTV